MGCPTIPHLCLHPLWSPHGRHRMSVAQSLAACTTEWNQAMIRFIQPTYPMPRLYWRTPVIENFSAIVRISVSARRSGMNLTDYRLGSEPIGPHENHHEEHDAMYHEQLCTTFPIAGILASRSCLHPAVSSLEACPTSVH